MDGLVRNYQPLEIKYSDPSKKRIAGCGLSLRTYNGELVGPTLRVKPGQTLRFTVKNDLSSREGTSPSPTHETMPGIEIPTLDLTNLHTHGAQVDPDGKRDANGNLITASDNVLIQYGPETSQDYEIKVPEDHPSGTFWYHAHAHRSTAVQVSSGMAGALIVEDDNTNLEDPESNQSILPDSLKNVTEKTLIFQSILYDENGGIANLDVSRDPQTWADSNRRITINGQLAPRITMRPGEVQRWRMIGGTFGELLRLRLAEHDLNEIALDGHYLPRVDTWGPDRQVDLQAGYRSDVLVKASTTPGTYMMINVLDPTGRFATPLDTNVKAQLERVVAAVVVEGEPVEDRALPTNAEMERIAYGWNDGQESEPLEAQWNRDPKDPQQVLFNLDPNTQGFAINGRAYNTDDEPRRLNLNQVDKWELSAERGGHVFHIHVNPFQVVRAGPDGSAERVWKDSIVVPPSPDPQNPTPLTIYTQYRTFTGRFVIHCHLLDHEDDGMMQQVQVE